MTTRLTISILALALLTGCSFGMKSIPPKHNPYFTRTLMAAPAPTLTLYAVFSPVANADGYRVYGGQSLMRTDWQLLGESTTNRIAFPTQVPGFGFIGVKAYNQWGESDWATR